MSFAAVALRREFPFLRQQPELHYLDNAAMAQIHERALEAMLDYETASRANVMRGNHRLAEAASVAYEDARRQVAAYLNAGSADEVVFVAGATFALNLVAHGFGTRLGAGDEIVLSAAEHHSNLLPWQAVARRAGARLKFLPLTADGRVDVAALGAVVTERCRLIALAHASNVTGAVLDVAAVVAAARAVGARVLLDGAQAAPHGPVDLQSLGVDFYVFSGHKCYGPTGVGVLWARGELLAALSPFLVGGGMVSDVALDDAGFADPPRRFEAGTPPVGAAIGLGAALARLAELPWPAVRAHETALAERLLDGLARRPRIRLIGPRDLDARLPVVTFDIDGLHPHDVCQVLDRRDVALRGGHHCAQPLMRHFGIAGASRASIGLYNTAEDIDALLDGLDDVERVLA